MRKQFLLSLLAASLFAPVVRAEDWVSRWFDMVSRTTAEQPAWTTPLVTSSAKLDQRFRYDLVHSQTTSGDVWNFGNSKGLDLIVAPRLEVIAALPPYLQHDNPRIQDGLGDCSFQLRYRLRSRNEERGNYIVTLFLNATIPTGTYRNGAIAPVITPTLAIGKGFWNSRLVWQSTTGLGIPVGESARLGYPLQLNHAFQYRVRKYFWPQVEANATFFYGGNLDGRKQLFLTPGLVCGRFPLHNRIGLTLGSGMQIATTSFHSSNHNVVFTFRSAF